MVIYSGFAAKRTIRPLVLPETLVLASLCIADMLQTLYVVGRGLAIEANPVLASAMERGPWAFIAVKSASFLAPLGAVELLRPRCPNFIRLCLRLGAAGYLLIYLFGSLHINHVVPIPFLR